MIGRHLRHLPVHGLAEIAQLRLKLGEALLIIALGFAEEQASDLIDLLPVGSLLDGWNRI
jgi:hypothetical protein